MAKTAYLEALKRAMTGLPPDVQAKTLAYYEQRFVDGVTSGRSEEDVARELDEPKKVAMTLRANVHMQAFQTKKSPGTFIRMAFAAVGLVIFNLVMVLPAIVYASVLASLYAFGLIAYLYGIVISSSGITGVTEFHLDRVAEQVHIDESGLEHSVNLRVVIQGPNMRFFATHHPGREKQIGSAGVMFARELETASRPAQTFLGFGITLSGIMVLLLSLLLTRYTLVGIRRYVDMNLSLLKGH